MDFIQDLNPLYAGPIIAVIICAFIVYAFGFKSPVPPPSFDGIEDGKKTSKKRKTKDTQKNTKAIQNGKLNAQVTAKAPVVPAKKKDEKVSPKSAEKTAVRKKPAKETKPQVPKKNVERKESIPEQDINDDGWVQLVSKKERKNRKKEEVEPKTSEPKKKESPKPSAKNQGKDEPKTEVQVEKIAVKSEVEKIAVKSEVESAVSAKIESTAAEKKKQQPKIEKPAVPSPEISVAEDKGKSKKKKKNVATEKAITDEAPKKPVSDEPPKKSVSNEPKFSPATDDSAIVTMGKPEVIPTTEEKNSNIVFDELAGLYPEAKEQKKKKKVRRDH